MENPHQSVLLIEAVKALNLKSDGLYIDATLGRCGHSKAILNALGDSGRLIAFDQDLDAIDYARSVFQNDARISLVHQNFSSLRDYLQAHGLMGQVDGILFDLGICSTQVDDGMRGFSFRKEAPLDMRMDRRQKLTAADILAQYSERQLTEVLKMYGEEPCAKRISSAICKQRKERPIKTTLELAALITQLKPFNRHTKIHPATLTFQALRICVNRELEVLKSTLDTAVEALKPGGRIAVISFHSLEDRIVKRCFRQYACDQTPRQIPIEYDKLNKILNLINKPIRPTEFEKRQNPRARSAIMRVAEKNGYEN